MDEFKPVDDPSILLPVLEKRLPMSCHIYNCALMHDRFPDSITFYILGDEVTTKTWILRKVIRDDYGTGLSISSPPGEPVTSAVRYALSTTPYIDWSEAYLFAALEKHVSQIVHEISVNDYGNSIDIHPCRLYFLNLNEGSNLKIRKNDDEIRVQSLDGESGLRFILNTWKYVKAGTTEYVQKLINYNESGAVYVNNIPVAGVTTLADGMCAMLYTIKPHRRKGFGGEALKYCLRTQAQNGLYPCLTVECRNLPSVQFHDKVGMHDVGQVDWICYTASGFD